MKSKIYLKEVVDNKYRKFGADLVYYPARLENEDGSITEALFTKDQIERAVKRAVANPEDIPELTFLQNIFG